MPQLNTASQEKAQGGKLPQAIEPIVGQLTVSSSPVLIVGINRRLGIGNYEHIDLFAGISLPMEDVNLADGKEAIRDAVVAAAEVGFNVCSTEIHERIYAIKQASKPQNQVADTTVAD